MTRTVTSTFTTAAWDERDIEGAAHALRHTSVHYGVSYFGEISGTSTIDLVMVYKVDGTVSFVGYEFFEGSIGRSSGTVVFEHRGIFENEGAGSELTVVPGTTTGTLDDLAISGRMFVPQSGEGTIALDISENA